MTLVEMHGNLFDKMNPKDCYCHCIAIDGKYGAGIAPVFIDQVFNQRAKLLYELDHLTWNTQQGFALLIPSEKGLAAHLITKENTFSKPTYTTVYSALLDLKKQLQERNFTGKIKMPKIASGLDKLNWQRVKETIVEVFGNTNYEIEVYYL